MTETGNVLAGFILPKRHKARAAVVVKLEKGNDLIHLFKQQKTKLFALSARGQVPRPTHDVDDEP